MYPFFPAVVRQLDSFPDEFVSNQVDSYRQLFSKNQLLAQMPHHQNQAPHETVLAK